MKIFQNRFQKNVVVCILVFILIAFLCFVFIYNKIATQGDGIELLSELMKRDFAGVEITDIQYKYVEDDALMRTRTEIFVFLKEPVDWPLKEYYYNRYGAGIFDPDMDQIPPGEVEHLEEIGIGLSQIQKHGGNFNQIEVGSFITPYIIHWYKIDESYDGKSNFVLSASIPRKVSFNVDGIIQGQYNNKVEQ